MPLVRGVNLVLLSYFTHRRHHFSRASNQRIVILFICSLGAIGPLCSASSFDHEREQQSTDADDSAPENEKKKTQMISYLLMQSWL